MVALAVKRDDEHGAAVHFAAGLARADFRRIVALGSCVADAFAKATAAEFFGAAEEVDGIVRVIGGEDEFHGAVMAVAEREDVHPHARASVASEAVVSSQLSVVREVRALRNVFVPS